MNEKDFQHHVVERYVTGELGSGLGYQGAPFQTSSCVDPLTGIVQQDVLIFLKAGNDSNKKNWQRALELEKKGNPKNAESRLEKSALLAVVDKINDCETILRVLREGVKIEGLSFALWNNYPQTGDTKKILDKKDFEKNTLRLINEVNVKTPNSLRDVPVFSGRAEFQHQELTQRLDQCIFVNGLPYAYMQLKSLLTGQSSTTSGMRQIAQDFVVTALAGLYAVRQEFNRVVFHNPWRGLTSIDSPLWKKKALSSFPSWYGKSPWQATLDEKNVFLAPQPWACLVKVDDFLTRVLSGTRFPEKDYDSLIREICQDFSQMPDMILDDPKPSNITKEHLRSLLSHENLEIEISLFGHPSVAHDSKQTNTFLTTAPRAPQRVALGQIQRHIDEMYQNEHDPMWVEKTFRKSMEKNRPGLSWDDGEKKLKERMAYKNGQEAYSIIIQGAAGLGKTNIAVWTAAYLAGKLETDDRGHPTSQHMFDFIIVLTDRVELRENMAKAASDKGTRDLVVDVETTQVLRDVLSGNYNKGAGRILVVNLQKFPHFKKDIESAKTQIKRSGGRIAFIIDEIHRSNQGSLNADAQDSFLGQDDNDKSFIETLEVAGQGNGQKRNLIVGLTATPSDPVLARFGQWSPGLGAGATGSWAPHFSYAMDKAIEDGHILNPLAAMMRLETSVRVDQDATLLAATDHGINTTIPDHLVYADDEWRKKASLEIGKIFATTTMPAMRDKNQANKVGRGKMMITLPSIATAAGFLPFLRNALLELADNAQGKAWQNYADVIRDVAENRIFIIYSDPSERAEFNEKCWNKNPLLDGKVRNEKQIKEGFACSEAGSLGNKRNSIIIVVDKLLTGYDEPTLHTLVIARHLSGIALLQAMCRVNRTRHNKNNCLVVDASISGNTNGLMPEARRVFGKYGGLALSDLDGVDLLKRVTEQGKTLRNNWDGVIQKEYTAWKKRGADDVSLHDHVVMALAGLTAAKDDNVQIRRTLGGYLSQQKLACNIMQLKKDDLDKTWLTFLTRLHNAMRTEKDDDGRTPVQFTVEDVGITMDSNHVLETVKARQGKDDDALMRDALLKDNDIQLDLNEQLGALQNSEEEKTRAIRLLRNTLRDTGKKVDEIAARDPVIFQEAKKILHEEMDYNNKIESFSKILAAARIDRTDGVAWIDAEPGRRLMLDWAGERGRKEWVMAHWIAETQLTSL